MKKIKKLIKLFSRGGMVMAIAFAMLFGNMLYVGAVGTTPLISTAVIKTSGTSAIVQVNFNLPVFAASDGSGNLAVADFKFTDAAAPWADISWVSHTAGDDFAIVGISGPVTTNDKIAAANNSSIFVIGGQLKQTDKTITADSTVPAIQSVEYLAGNTDATVLVTFSEPVYGTIPSFSDHDGAIVEIGDFNYTDSPTAGAGDIGSLSQAVGSKYIRLVLDATAVSADVSDTINCVASNVYDAVGNTAATTAWRMDDNTDTRPRVSTIEVVEGKTIMKVVFTEGVTDDDGTALDADSIKWWDATAVAASDAFAIVTHIAGSDTVYLHDADTFDVSADGLEIIAEKVMDGAGNYAATCIGAPGTSGSIGLDGVLTPYVITADNTDTAPTVTSITRGADKDMLTIVFSEGVVDDDGSALDTGCFQLNNGTTQDAAIGAVIHTAGSATATVYYSGNFDVSADMLEIEADKVYDVFGNGFSATEVKYTLNNSAIADATAPTITGIAYGTATKCATVTFSEGVTSATGAALGTGDIKFFDHSNGTPGTTTSFSSVAHTAGATDVLVCYSEVLQTTDVIEIVASKIADKAGNYAAVTTYAGGVDVATGLISGGTADTTVPAITAIHHRGGVTKCVTVEFNDVLYDPAGNALTTADDIKFFDQSDTGGAIKVFGTGLVHTAGTNSVFACHSGNLATDDVIAIVASQVMDKAGNFAAATTFAGGLTLATGLLSAGTADETAPVISAIAENAGNTKYITVTFNEAVYESDMTGIDTSAIEWFDASHGTPGTSTPWTAVAHTAGDTKVFCYISGQVVAADDDVEIIATAILDRAGNAAVATTYNGSGVANGEINYGTADTAAPLITSIDVGTDKKILKVTFDSSVYEADGTAVDATAITLYDTNGGTESGTAADTVTYTLGGSSVILYFSGGYESIADMLEFVAAVTVDEAGNPLAEQDLGIAIATIAADTTAPTITGITHNAPNTNCVTVTFSEAVTDETGSALDTTDIEFFNETSSTSFSSVTHVAGETTAFCCYSSALALTDEIEIITSRVTDGSGNYAAVTTADGSTVAQGSINAGTADTVAPTVSGVYTNTDKKAIKVVFSEVVCDSDGSALDTASITFNDVSVGGTGSAFTQVAHTAGSTDFYAYFSSAFDSSADTLEFVDALIQDAAGNTVGTAQADIAMDASTNYIDNNQTVPSISSIHGTVGDTMMLVTFNEPVFTAATGAGALVLADDLTYTDTGSSDTVTLSHTAGSPYVVLTRSAAVVLADIDTSDTIAAKTASAIYDNNGVAVATDTVNLIDTVSPILVSAETMDVSANGLIDYFKLTFSEPIDEAAITNYATGALATSTMGTEVGIAAIAAPTDRYEDDDVFLDDSATVGGEATTDNDTILYIKFAQESDDTTDVAQGDTDVKPELTTATATFKDFANTANTLANVATTDLTETDGALPVIYATTTKGITGAKKLVVAFSEGVYSTNGTSGALALADFAYVDTSATGATAIDTGTAAVHVAGQRKLVLTMNADLDITEDAYDDTIAAVTSSIYDTVGNIAPTTTNTFQIVTGDKTITLVPGWNVVSTPDHLTAIEFSNTGSNIYFYQLAAGTWSAVTANTTNITPLTGYFVNNATSADVSMYLGYNAMETSMVNNQVSKSLSAGWNTIGTSIGGSAVYDDAVNILGGGSTNNSYDTVIDFTSSGFGQSAATSWAYTSGTQKSSTEISSTALDLAETVGYGIYIEISKNISGTTDN